MRVILHPQVFTRLLSPGAQRPHQPYSTGAWRWSSAPRRPARA
jgi:hypothetical protein